MQGRMTLSTEKVKISKNCKICQLYTRNLLLWEDLHRKSYLLHMPNTAVHKWLVSQLPKLQEGLSPEEIEADELTNVSLNSLSNHLNTHITSYNEFNQALTHGVIYLTKAKGLGAANLTKERQTKEVEARLKLGYVGDAVDDFSRLDQLVTASETRLTEYNKKLSETDEHGRVREVDLTEIQLFQKLIKELMGMKKELSTLQNSEAVAGKAVQEGIEQIVGIIMETLQGSLSEMRANLARELPGSTIPVQMEKLVTNKMALSLKDSVPILISEVYKRYKIK